MSDEPKAAVERLRKASTDGWMLAYSERPMFGHPSRQMEDWEIIAAAYLADHPADDDVLVTNEWIGGFGHMESLRLWQNELGWNWSWRGGYCGVLDSVKTRGDVRKLCRSLGIELKESRSSEAVK